MNKLVSIITPLYNKFEYIKETIYSVEAQTYENWELIVVDDGSTDGSDRLVLSFNNPKIKFLRNNSGIKGPSAARNEGIVNAQGVYVIFLDADDLLLPNCLESRVNYIDKTNEDFVVFQMMSFGNDLAKKTTLKSDDYLFDFLSNDWKWVVTAPIWKKEALIKIGCFDVHFRNLEDPELHTRALLMGLHYTVLCDAENDSLYRQFPNRKLNLSLIVESYFLYLDNFINLMGSHEQVDNKYNACFLASRKRAFNNVLCYYSNMLSKVDKTNIKKYIHKINHVFLQHKFISNSNKWQCQLFFSLFFAWIQLPFVSKYRWIFKKINTKLI